MIVSLKFSIFEFEKIGYLGKYYFRDFQYFVFRVYFGEIWVDGGKGILFVEKYYWYL